MEKQTPYKDGARVLFYDVKSGIPHGVTCEVVSKLIKLYKSRLK